MPGVVLHESLQQIVGLGVLVCRGAKVQASLPEQLQELDAQCARLHDQYQGVAPGSILELRVARKLYRATGVDPTRTRPSSEALLRRVVKDKGLYHINNVVDAGNMASLNALLPISLFNLAEIDGDIEIRLGRDGEEYPGIRKDTVHLTGRLAVFDSKGPIGCPTSDSPRTMIRDTSRDLLAIMYATADYSESQMLNNLGYLSDLLQRHCEAKEEGKELVFPAVD